MNEKVKTLGEQARELSAQDRIALVENVLDSLDRPDPSIDRLWAKEAGDRLAAYRRVSPRRTHGQGPQRRRRQIPAVTVRFVGEGVRRCRMNRFPYGLIYAVDNGDILVLAVAHLHREPGYWRDRLKR